MNPSKRLFVAINLPEEMIHEFSDFRNCIPRFPQFRWMPDDNLHITTCFIGDLNISDLPYLIDLLGNVASRTKFFNLDFDCFQLAPHRNPYMIWAKFKSNLEFTALYNDQNQLLKTKEKLMQPAIPHITMARFKGTIVLRSQDLNYNLKNNHFDVKSFMLVESELHKSGSKYYKIEDFKLLEY